MTHENFELHFVLYTDNIDYKIIQVNINDKTETLEDIILFGIDKYNNLYKDNKISEDYNKYIICNNLIHKLNLNPNLKKNELENNVIYIIYKNNDLDNININKERNIVKNYEIEVKNNDGGICCCLKSLLCCRNNN